MKPLKILSCVAAAGLTLTSSVQAADVRINGFASVVAGTTLSEGTGTHHFTGAESDAVFAADKVTGGAYDDEISFKPDSTFGIQISSDLGHGLSVTGQITGHGGEDYDAVISWAYIGYDLTDNLSLQAGRQRLPFYYYSDFIDVGYAYHWVRPPSSLAIAIFDTFEGLNLRYSGYTGGWDWNASLMGGGGDEDVESIGTITIEKMYGTVIKANNSWLQLRGSYFEMDQLYPDVNYLTLNGEVQGTDDNPLGTTFYGLAAHMTFGNAFVVSEFTHVEYDEPLGADNGAIGFDEEDGWYISAGYRMGDFTPHITVGEKDTTFVETGAATTGSRIAKELTVGVRWDFHPSAAAKFEYSSISDDSNDFYKNQIGLVGYGDSLEVDVITVGVDVIF